MKVNMYNWAHEVKTVPSWFKHNEVIDITWKELSSLIKELLDSNIQVMLLPGYITMLYIDIHRFSMR